ncbi:hypothetical protein DAEQUDRAFT_720063 [Daedalea quercina L-15889]|uniref:Uncharacterized protein n=1 Tax=Daedalea quercina L-15889 TaxID=1314783 RepID=A0A165UGL3_9APHY|nr:hypothetical protein DAEQUDRAFT_720063 [Daedalea quercina L-15889]
MVQKIEPGKVGVRLLAFSSLASSIHSRAIYESDARHVTSSVTRTTSQEPSVNQKYPRRSHRCMCAPSVHVTQKYYSHD